MNIYCHLDVSFLHCIVVLCDSMMKRDSQVQGGCYRKMNWWHLTDLQNLKARRKI